MYKKLKVISLILFVTFFFSSAAWTELKKNPYVQNAAQDGITILWETTGPLKDTLEWGETEALGESVQDDSAAAMHEHRITGLDKETTYYYRVVSDGTPTETKTFTTAPDTCTPFRFILTGDTRSGDANHIATTARMLDADADFILNTGDVIDAEDSDIVNEAFWQVHFNIEKDLMAEVPEYIIWGNHDVGSEAIYQRLFDAPDDESGSEFFYSFRWGNSLFVSIDVMREYTMGTDQYEWLQGVLEEAKEDETLQHVFVSYHVPGISTGPHGNNDTIIDHLHPLFYQNGVQATFSGHDHTFQHLQTNNVNFIVSGGGGASLYDQESYSAHLIYFAKRFHMCTFDVAGPSVTMECVDSFTGQKFYEYSWTDDMGHDVCGAADDDDDDSTADDDDDSTADDDDDSTADDDDSSAGDDDEDETPDGAGDDDDDDDGGCCG